MKKMYTDRKANISVFRGCNYSCVYCSFGKMLKLSNCISCKAFEPHTHLEVLQKTPPKTAKEQFITIGLSSDVAFMSHDDLVKVSSYCAGWPDRTFLIQSKNPAVFLEHYWPDNVILGTTLETNNSLIYSPERPIAYNEISQAPFPCDRIEAMKRMDCRKAITIEPILSFNRREFKMQIEQIAPEFVYIGYNSNLKLHLPEPPLAKTLQLIEELRTAGIEVRTKLLRKAYYER